MRGVRDPLLLEAVDGFARVGYNGSLFRVVRNGRDPLEPSRNGNRWDLGHFDVLYISLDADGAIAEIDFHLSRQPAFPSLYKPTLYELKITLGRVAVMDTMSVLERLGVKRESFPTIRYEKTRDIGDAVAFLGFDGLMIPSARWSCLNIVVITDEVPPGSLSVVSEHGIIDLREWRDDKAKAVRIKREPN